MAWFKYMNKSQLGDPCVQSIKCNGPIEVRPASCCAGACARARQRLVLRPKPVRAGAAASDA